MKKKKYIASVFANGDLVEYCSTVAENKEEAKEKIVKEKAPEIIEVHFDDFMKEYQVRIEASNGEVFDDNLYAESVDELLTYLSNEEYFIRRGDIENMSIKLLGVNEDPDNTCGDEDLEDEVDEKDTDSKKAEEVMESSNTTPKQHYMKVIIRTSYKKNFNKLISINKLDSYYEIDKSKTTSVMVNDEGIATCYLNETGIYIINENFNTKFIINKVCDEKIEVFYDYITPFKDITDEELINVLNRHYSTSIDIADYWNIGDTRNFKITDTCRPYPYYNLTGNVEMVIVGFNHDELSSPTVWRDKAALTIAAKNIYPYSTYPITFIDTEYDYKHTAINKFLEKNFYNALSISKYIKPIVKEDGNEYKCFIPSADEVFPPETVRFIFGEVREKQYPYYKEICNRIKDEDWLLRNIKENSFYTCNKDGKLLLKMMFSSNNEGALVPHICL
jgi:hypothetical protein